MSRKAGILLGAFLPFLDVGGVAPAVGQGTVSPGGCVLTADPPDGFTLRRDRAGIVLQPVGAAGRRSIFEIRLSLGRSASTALTETRPIGARVARYRLTREAVGSGGEETTLVAEMPGANGIIRLEAWMQRDDGAAIDFHPTWHALATARCSSPEPR